MAARDEDEAIVDDCYEAATDASDFAGSISGGDSDNDHVDPMEFYDGQPGSEVVEVEDGKIQACYGNQFQKTGVHKPM